MRDKIIDLNGTKCRMEFGIYGNGQTAIQLFDCRDGQLYTVATVAIDEIIYDNEVAIKNYSENEGMLDILVKEGIVSKPLRYTRYGFVEIPICELLV